MFTLSKSNPHAASRTEASQVAWAEIAFLDPHLSSYDGLKMRPLLTSWLEEAQGIISPAPTDDGIDPREVLSCLHTQLKQSKKIGEKARLIWLTGAYLQAVSENVSTPFNVSTSQLVRSHFFEPAVMLDSIGNIYSGWGVDKIRRAQGPMRLRVLKRDDQGTLFWALLASNEENFGDVSQQVSAAVSPNFSDVEYALSHCVQQCLVLEPLLAAALSLGHDFDPKEFRSAVCSTFPETMAQHTKGCLDGELNELVMFAAIQLACRSRNRKKSEIATQSVSGFITDLQKYLKIQNREENFDLFKYDLKPLTEKKVDPKIATPVYKPYNEEKVNEERRDRAKEMLEEKLPWLVPACSEARLKDAIDTYGKNVFNGIDIAGLAPGGDTTRTDAKAIAWDTGTVKWAFEFRARVGYTFADACKDLTAKCEGRPYHCMLIASTNDRHSTCQYWTTGDQAEFLRVVLVVGNKR
ncbi:MAG: hypothetical protein SGILL_010543 [Bacillariaceae sp.]